MEAYCQSCGMPLTEEVLGTEKDGSKNQEYCMYCYKEGAFTDDHTMDEMIEICADIIVKEDKSANREEEIRKMKEYFPKLKRWSK